MHPPARGRSFLAIETFAEKPETAAVDILDAVVVARAREGIAPPFGSDPLRPLGGANTVQPAAPAELRRRRIRKDRQRLDRLGPMQQERRARLALRPGCGCGRGETPHPP